MTPFMIISLTPLWMGLVAVAFGLTIGKRLAKKERAERLARKAGARAGTSRSPASFEAAPRKKSELMRLRATALVRRGFLLLFGTRLGRPRAPTAAKKELGHPVPLLA